MARGDPPGSGVTPGAGAARSTVVLRAGPSRRKGLVIDIATGVLGVLLLASSVALLNILPHVDVPPNEYRVTFVPVQGNLTKLEHNFVEGSAQNFDFLFEVPDDDVYSVTVQVSFTDDVVTSKPDKFSFAIYNPGGEPVEGQDPSLSNVAARFNSTSSTFEAVPASLTHSVTMTSKPQDAIFKAVEGATAGDVEAALEKQNHLLTKGTWKVRVNLVDAGDCPDPPTPPAIPTQDDVQRVATCRQATSSGNPQDTGKDLGNKFTVGVFSYSRFVVHAEKFG